MTLQDAWYKLLDLDNFNELSPSQVFSILSDFGVFVVSPKLKIAIKTALNYGLWNIVIKSDSAHQISILRSKLENDGFADTVIDDILSSFVCASNRPAINEDDRSTNTHNNEKIDSLRNEEYELPFYVKKGIDENITTFASNSSDLGRTSKDNNSKHSSNPLSDSVSEQSNEDTNDSLSSHIVFLGKELGCTEIEMLNHLEMKGFKHVGFSYDGTRREYSGCFLGISDSVVAIWKTPKTKLVWRIEIRLKVPIDIIEEIYKKKYVVEKRNYPVTYFKCKFGTICVRCILNDTIIEYEDNETFKLRQIEVFGKVTEKSGQLDGNQILNQVNLDEI